VDCSAGHFSVEKDYTCSRLKDNFILKYMEEKYYWTNNAIN
jgi:hypothetical protein